MGVTILVAAVAPTLVTEGVALFAMGAAAFAFIAVANTTIQLTAAPEMRGPGHGALRDRVPRQHADRRPDHRLDLAALRSAVRLRDRRGRHDRGDGAAAWSILRMRGSAPGGPRRDRGPIADATGNAASSTPTTRRRRRDADDRRRRRGRRATAGSPRRSSRRAAPRQSGSRPNSRLARRWRSRSQHWSSITSSSRSRAGSCFGVSWSVCSSATSSLMR